jgi:uncharacterized RmlC-like cupin family protein
MRSQVGTRGDDHMSGGHFSFSDAPFETIVAHSGRGEIHVAPVVDRGPNPGCLFLHLDVMPPGSSIGMHTHGEDDEEIYIVIEGSGRMIVDGASFRVGPGDVVINPTGGAHGLDNDGESPLRLIVVDVGTPAPADSRTE